MFGSTFTGEEEYPESLIEFEERMNLVPAPGADLATEGALFEAAMNAARFFPAELNFARTKSPSGRDEYANSHLQSCWVGWQARASLAARQAPTAIPKLNLCEHMWELQPVSASVRMTEKCRFCHEVREIATAQGKAQ
jgi:hypothetical protein